MKITEVDFSQPPDDVEARYQRLLPHSLCVRCKYFYRHGQGYSDFTWLDIWLNCSKDANDSLPIIEPFDYDDNSRQSLRWLASLSLTSCEHYQLSTHGQPVQISPEGNVPNWPDDDDMMVDIIRHMWAGKGGTLYYVAEDDGSVRVDHDKISSSLRQYDRLKKKKNVSPYAAIGDLYEDLDSD